MKRAILLRVLSLLSAAIVSLAADPIEIPFYPGNPNGEITTNDVVYTEAPRPSVPFSIQSVQTSPTNSVWFQGLDDNNAYIPPDVAGGVGTNHVVTMLNTQVRVHDRTGAIIYDTKSLFDWWTNSGSFTRLTDPRILYDHVANRWIASVAVDQGLSTAGTILAVSTNSDPTGVWQYVRVNAEQSANTRFADYPILGFNKDLVILSMSIHNNSDASFSATKILAFSKSSLYSGGSSRTVYVDSIDSPACPITSYDNLSSGMYLARAWNPGAGWVRMEIISQGTYYVGGFAKTDPWANLPNGDRNFAPQLNSTTKIDTTDGRVENCVLRNGWIWFVQTIFLPATNPTHSAIQWWQVSGLGEIRQRGLIQNTNGPNFYAFPSIAVNKFDDILIGFNSFSTNQYASAMYAFRASSDELNTMRTAQLLKGGEAVYVKKGQNGLYNRWGDYSTTTVDPVNDTDFWTLQEYAAQPVTNIDRWGVWWGKITVPVPENDNFSNAIALSGGEGTNYSTMFRGLKETGEPNHAGATGGRSVWFSWTAPTGGWVSFDTLRTVYANDTVVAVYTGTAVNSLTLVTSNDDVSAANKLSAVSFNATSGVTYRIAVDSKSATTEKGDLFSLYWLQPTAPYFTKDPEPDNVNVLGGDQFVLLSTAIGAPSPQYQWRSNSVVLAGETSANYTNSNPQSTSTNSPTTFQYSVIASNSLGVAISRVANVTVYPTATATHTNYMYDLLNNYYSFHVFGVTTHVYEVQGTMDFTNWTTLTNKAASFDYTNSVTTNFPYRFFRTKY